MRLAAVLLPLGLVLAPASAFAQGAEATPAGQATVATVSPEPAPAMHNVAARTHVELAGPWAHIVDRYRLGARGRRMRDIPADIVAADQEMIEYEWSSSPVLTVPGDWNSQRPELEWYEGMVWYRRAFEASPRPGTRQFLYFEAVNYRARVWLNGEEVGSHEGGFTPFEIEVTGRLRGSGNVLILAVDSEHRADTVPPVEVDWWNFGGITRPVRLVEVPETFVRNWTTRLTPDGFVEVTAALDGPAARGAQVSLRLDGLGGGRTARAGADGRASFRFRPRGLQRWSPARPRLYDFELAAGADRVTDRVGFRTIAVDGTRILLNGAPVTMLGISLHEEPIGPSGGRTLTPASARALLQEAKDLGANFVRLAHYPHSELMARLADEMGLMVWAEIPVYWDVAFGNPDTLARARSMLAELIERDRNRASVVIWSVANETPGTPERLAFLDRLIRDARERDGTRLVSAALHADDDASAGPGGRVVVNDPLGALVDIVAFNRYEGWYGGRNPDQIDEVRWEVAFAKPFILSEFGADALHGYRAGPLDRWSEDYQARLYERTLAMTARIPHFAGVSPWILKDFRSPRRMHYRFQNFWNRKGVIDPEGRRKQAWHVLHDWYRAQHAGRYATP